MGPRAWGYGARPPRQPPGPPPPSRAAVTLSPSRAAVTRHLARQQSHHHLPRVASRVMGPLHQAQQRSHCHLAPGRVSSSPCTGHTVVAHLLLFKSDPVTPRTAACQVPLSMGFSQQEHWSGLPFPSPGIKPTSPTVAGIMSE